MKTGTRWSGNDTVAAARVRPTSASPRPLSSARGTASAATGSPAGPRVWSDPVGQSDQRGDHFLPEMTYRTDQEDDMLQGMATVSFYAADLDAAARWYAEVLGIEPYYVRPGYVEFRVGPHEDELGIIDARYAPSGGPRARAARSCTGPSTTGPPRSTTSSSWTRPSTCRSRRAARVSSPQPWSTRSATCSASCPTRTGPSAPDPCAAVAWSEALPGSTDGRRRERHQVGAMVRRRREGSLSGW